MKTAMLTLLFVVSIVYADETAPDSGDDVDPVTCQDELDSIEAEIAEIIEQTGSHPIGAIKPQCLKDGTYTPRQCLGSVCNCVAADGSKLTDDFGIGEAVNTDCSCAREKQEYKLSGKIGKSFKCTDIGSYAPVQCTGSVCYCSDIKGQQLGQETVNIGFIDTLKC
ncbi:equistatin-like [Mizuhopecten yessoensis]|uniref:Thyroglobulin n=1 Tax=Mizuhopecten yessoensis TaxID=6573 RepID=A0A210QMT8_MIZYE|nr:equistatin-like [Mizuhopecten yessoensis]OWF50021.1 Thyroglobulin [Mizuhopecten yessoensis]